MVMDGKWHRFPDEKPGAGKDEDDWFLIVFETIDGETEVEFSWWDGERWTEFNDVDQMDVKQWLEIPKPDRWRG